MNMINTLIKLNEIKDFSSLLDMLKHYHSHLKREVRYLNKNSSEYPGKANNEILLEDLEYLTDGYIKIVKNRDYYEEELNKYKAIFENSKIPDENEELLSKYNKRVKYLEGLIKDCKDNGDKFLKKQFKKVLNKTTHDFMNKSVMFEYQKSLEQSKKYMKEYSVILSEYPSLFDDYIEGFKSGAYKELYDNNYDKIYKKLSLKYIKKD